MENRENKVLSPFFEEKSEKFRTKSRSRARFPFRSSSRALYTVKKRSRDHYYYKRFFIILYTIYHYTRARAKRSAANDVRVRGAREERARTARVCVCVRIYTTRLGGGSRNSYARSGERDLQHLFSELPTAAACCYNTACAQTHTRARYIYTRVYIASLDDDDTVRARARAHAHTKRARRRRHVSDDDFFSIIFPSDRP